MTTARKIWVGWCLLWVLIWLYLTYKNLQTMGVCSTVQQDLGSLGSQAAGCASQGTLFGGVVLTLILAGLSGAALLLPVGGRSGVAGKVRARAGEWWRTRPAEQARKFLDDQPLPQTTAPDRPGRETAAEPPAAERNTR